MFTGVFCWFCRFSPRFDTLPFSAILDGFTLFRRHTSGTLAAHYEDQEAKEAGCEGWLARMAVAREMNLIKPYEQPAA
jgi:hypothetical protein